jgi:hypothetical protein
MKLAPVLLVLVLLAQSLATLADAKPTTDDPQQSGPASWKPTVVNASATAPPHVAKTLSKLEGWGFLGEGSLHPKGRVTLQLNWSAPHEEASGLLRWNDTTSIRFTVTRDDAAWLSSAPQNLTIERYTGTTTTAQSVLLDLIPSEGYVSGYVEAANLDPRERLTFQVYDTPAKAIASITTLLDTGHGADSRAPQNANGPVPTLPPLVLPPASVTPILSDGQPHVGKPESRLPGSLGLASILTGLGPRILPRVDAAAESGGTSPSAGSAEGQGGGASGGGGGIGVPMPIVGVPAGPMQPVMPVGPTSLPVGQAGVYASATITGNGDQTSLTFYWGDNTSATWGPFTAGGPGALQHAWTAAGVYSVTVVARDASTGATSAPSSPLVVSVTNGLGVPPTPSAGNQAVAVIPPEQPSAPSASVPTAMVGASVNFSAVTIDPRDAHGPDPTTPNGGHPLMYEFSWDDRNTTWTAWAASGQTVTASHTWSQPGDYRVQVQARNADGNCKKRGGAVGSCVSLWSKTTTIHIAPATTDAAPSPASLPTGWDVAAWNSTATFTSTTGTDPDGTNVLLEMDWNDGTYTFSAPVAGGSTVSLQHSWNTLPSQGQTHYVRARTLDPQGVGSAWSAPWPIFIGNATQPFEFAVTNLTVGVTTPHGFNAGNTTETENEAGSLFTLSDQVPIAATIDDRSANTASSTNGAAQPTALDVVFYDDGKPFDQKSTLISAGQTVVVNSVEPIAGMGSTGVHEISVKIAQSIAPPLEVTQTNNFRKVDISVRDATTGSNGYGALYDGTGPINVDNAQLTAGLYAHQRTSDEDTFDDAQSGTSTPMRLLLWSANFAGTKNQTWYFVDSADATVTGTNGITLTGAAPTSTNVGGNLSEAFPLTSGYSTQAGNGPVEEGIAYNVGNGTTLNASSTSIAWHVTTNTTPTDNMHAIGFQFNANAPNASTSAWANVTFTATVHYTRVDNNSNDTYTLWHEVLNASTDPTHPIVGSLEDGNWVGSNTVSVGDDYNMGDRSMTSQPVWDAPADSRRTYYDGTSDKDPQDQQGNPNTGSAAYLWFRLDGPIYQGHWITWVFQGPDPRAPNSTQTASLYLPGPEDLGYAQGEYITWEEARDPLTFDQGLGTAYRGTWTGTLLIDNKTAATLTFHVLATTTDPKDGPYTVNGSYVENATGPTVNAVQDADPSNQNLDYYHPTDWQYLNESRIDQEVQGQQTSVNELADVLIVNYIQSQANEALDIAQNETDGACSTGNVSSTCNQVYALGHELVNEAANTPGCTARTLRVIAASQEPTVTGTARTQTDKLGVDASPAYDPLDSLVGNASAGQGCIVRSLVEQVWNAVDGIIQPCEGVLNPTLATVDDNIPTLPKLPSPGPQPDAQTGGGTGSGGSGTSGGGGNGTSSELLPMEAAPDLSCLSQTAAGVLNATSIVRNIANQTLSTVSTATSLVSMLLNDTGNLTGTLLNQTSGILNEAQNVSNLVTNATSLLPALPLQPSDLNLNPKLLGDTLGVAYDAVMQCADTSIVTPTCDKQQGPKEGAASTVDSLFYNLHVENEDASRNWTFLNVGIGNATPIDLDNNPATGVNGTDLLLTATLTPTQGTLPVTTNASQTAPTLRITALDSTGQSTPLLVCAFYQLPGVAYVAETCMDTRNATMTSLGQSPSSGFPSSANLTLSAYSFDTSNPNVTASLRIETPASNTQPILGIGSVYQVDLTQHTKPRVPGGDNAEASLFATNGQGEYDLKRSLDPHAGATSSWTWNANGASYLSGSYALTRAGRTLVAASNATAPPSQLTFTTLRNAADTTLDVTTQTVQAPGQVALQMGATRFAMSDSNATSTGEHVSLEAQALPASLTMHVDDAAGNATLATQGGALSGLRIVDANQRASCTAPSATSVISRQGADANGGSCFVLDSTSSIQSLSVSLASGGPSVSLTSTQTTNAPLAITMHPGLASARTLDASFSSTPRSLGIQSALTSKAATTPLDGVAPPPDGSTTITWTSSDELASARVLASSDGTTLYWNGTNVPTTAQAAYEWATDAVTIRAAQPTGGSIQLLLTNTGSVPSTPSGDYVAGTRSANAIQAAASFTSLDHYDANLAHESLTLDAADTAATSFGVRYARANGPSFSLDASSIPAGGFTLSTNEVEGGTHTTTYQASSGTTGALSWAGDFPIENAHLEGTLTAPGTLVTITSSPTQANFHVQTDGTFLTGLRILHAPTGASAQTLQGDDVLHLGNSVRNVDVYRASLGDIATMDYSNQSGSFSMSASQAPPLPLEVEVDSGASTLHWTTLATPLPGTLTASYGHAGLTTQSLSPADLDITNAAPTEQDHFHVHTLPSSLSLAWANSPGVTSATLTATQSVPSVTAQVATLTPGQAAPTDTVAMTLTSAAPSVSLRFDAAHDELQYASASAANGAPLATGFVSFLHANNMPGFSVPAQPQYATMTPPQSDATGAQALQLSNATSMDVRLGHAPGQANLIQLAESSTLPFFTQYDDPSTHATLAAMLSNDPGSVSLSYSLGADGANNTNAGAANLTMTVAGGAVTSTQLSATNGGSAPLALDLSSSSVTGTWNASWAPNTPFDLESSAPLVLNALAVRPVGQVAPALASATQDYVTTDGSSPASPTLGASFPAGVTLAHVDAANGNVNVQDASGRSVDLLDHEGSATLSLHAASIPSAFSLTTPPAGTPIALTWTGTGPTSQVTYALDASSARWRFDATSVPPSVTGTMDATNQRLSVNAPGGVGSIAVDYVNSGTGAFHSDGAGLTMIDDPTGPEGYDASEQSFALNMTSLTSLQAVIPSAATTSTMSLQLARTPTASPADYAFTLAGGPNAYRASTANVGTTLTLVAQPSDGTAGGLHDAITSSTSLASLMLQSRASAGTAILEATSVPTVLDLNASIDNQQGLHLAYTANGNAASVGWVVNASNVLTTAHSTSAPRDFRIDAPTACTNQAASGGRAWIPSHDTAGALSFFVASSDTVRAPTVPQPSFIVSSCAGNEATANVSGAGFQQAYWMLDPTTSQFTVSLDAQPSTPQDTSLELTGGDEGLALFANATSLAGGANVTAVGQSNVTAFNWTASGTSASTTAFMQTGSSTLNALLTSPPASFGLDAVPYAPNPLHYAASGPSASLAGNVTMPNMTTAFTAVGVPSALDWNFPLHAAPTPATTLRANVTTDGTGSVASLASWIIPTKTALVTNSTTEHAILETNGNDMQVDLNLSYLENVTWTQAPGNVGTSAAIAGASGISNAVHELSEELARLVGPSSIVQTPSATENAGVAPPSTPVAPASTAVTLVRDATAPSTPPSASLQANTGDQGAWIAADVQTPTASTSVSVAHDPAGSISHTFDSSGTSSGVITTYHDSVGDLAETILSSSGHGKTTYTPDGQVDHVGAATEVRLLLDAKGMPFLQANLTNNVPSHVTITPGTSTCDGQSAPYTFSVDTHSTGKIGNLDYRLTDDKQAPVIPGAGGLAIDCTSGASREIRGILPDVTVTNVQADPCNLFVTMPSTSLTKLTVPIITPSWSLNVTHQLQTSTVGLLNLAMTIDNNQQTNFDFTTADSTGMQPALSLLETDYVNRNLVSKDGTSVTVSGSACSNGMTFGVQVATSANGAPMPKGVQGFNTTLTGVQGHAHLLIGHDAAKRAYFSGSSGGIDNALVDIQLAHQANSEDPGADSQSAQSAHACKKSDEQHIAVDVATQLNGIKLSYHDSPAALPFDTGDASAYFYSRTTQSAAGGQFGLSHALTNGHFDLDTDCNPPPSQTPGPNGQAQAPKSSENCDSQSADDQAPDGWSRFGNLSYTLSQSVPFSLSMTEACSAVVLGITNLPAATSLSFETFAKSFNVAGSLSSAVEEVNFAKTNFMTLDAHAIPAGNLDVRLELGKAGRVVAQSDGGYIGDVSANIATGQNDYVAFNVAHVHVFTEWDLDGDTSYGGAPYHVYVDAGTFTGAVFDVRFHLGPVRVTILGVGTASTLGFGQWQLRFYPIAFSTFKDGHFPIETVGIICAEAVPIVMVGVDPIDLNFPVQVVPLSRCE